MKFSDILNSNSPEVKELFEVVDKIQSNLENPTTINKSSISGERFLDNNEVCEMLHLSSRTLQDYRNKGLLAFYKLEGKILYKLSDIQKMLEQNYYDAWKQSND